MPTGYDLIITADTPNLTAEFRLLDADGNQIAFRQADFNDITDSKRYGLFDLRRYLKFYAESGQEVAEIKAIGVCIAEEVLGEEIFRELWKAQSQRTLRIQLPGAQEEENHLAAALARVPWEIARPSADQPSLGERNLLVRVVHDMKASDSETLELAEGEPLRVLFIFAEAQGSTPLGMRREREELLQLFNNEIYPKRRITADFLSHGVTRQRLKEHIRDAGGYHLVHWSGHGHLNLLELAKPDGGKDYLSGEDLLGLFGGFIPRLFFLSACHSGGILQVKDWAGFLALAQGKEPGKKDSGEATLKDLDLADDPGYTGTAHALLHGGVQSVVAMRFAVGDDYARELAVEFYRGLLAHKQPKAAAAALTMARQDLLDPDKHTMARFDGCDHATPLLYGEEDAGLILTDARSPALDKKGGTRLHDIGELSASQHAHFVGRTWELAGLGANFIGASTGEEIKPVAVITGLGGMGKTALTAEILSLWEDRFDWILLYQAKPNALQFEAFLRDVHMKLYGELGRYHEHVQENRADAIHRPVEEGFSGPERLKRLTQNLGKALKAEPILLVLDNFETNLKPNAEGEAQRWACQDPAWEDCLTSLSKELTGSASRVLLTCRQPLTALPDEAAHPVLLGPLPPGEAALYLRDHEALSAMTFDAEESERALAMRLLNASRFHPLLMDRLARLAGGGEATRSTLLDALAALEGKEDFSDLPELFTRGHGDAQELAYLTNALASSLDQLISQVSPEARLLLWMIAVANEPVEEALLKAAWSGEEDEETRQKLLVKQLMQELPPLPEELQKELGDLITPDMRSELDALPTDMPQLQADYRPLLVKICALGLVLKVSSGYMCHDLISKRIKVWMDDHPAERSDLTETSVQLAYADHLFALYEELIGKNAAVAIQVGSRALAYCTHAGDHQHFGRIAGSLVTSSRDPALQMAWRPHLQAAVYSASDPQTRWQCLAFLADSFQSIEDYQASLSYYEQSAIEARSNTGSGVKEFAQRAASDLGVITGNWSMALVAAGNLGEARQRRCESIDAFRNAGEHVVNVIVGELELFRIEVMKGEVKAVLPEIEKRVDQIGNWWHQHLEGQLVREAPNAEILYRAYVSAHDIAWQAHGFKEDWESALQNLNAIAEAQRFSNRCEEDIATNRLNRAIVMGELEQYAQAQSELEFCLDIFKGDPFKTAPVLSSLASLFNKKGDLLKAIEFQRRVLSIREQFPHPRERAVSHTQLGIFLEQSSDPNNLSKSRFHSLAALVYSIVSESGQLLRELTRNHAVRLLRIGETEQNFTVPRLSKLLADPSFLPLKVWLCQHRVDIDELQSRIDGILN